MLLDGQVGGVGDVEAVLFGPPDQRVLQAEEVARAVFGGVGPVVGDDPGPVADGVHVRRAAAQALVVVVAAVEVPGLPGEHVVLDHVGGGAGRVPHRQRHVTLPVTRAGQLDQVVALDERPGDGERQRRGPVVAGHHVDAATGPGRAGCLEPVTCGDAQIRRAPLPWYQPMRKAWARNHGRGGADVQRHPLARSGRRPGWRTR